LHTAFAPHGDGLQGSRGASTAVIATWVMSSKDTFFQQINNIWMYNTTKVLNSFKISFISLEIPALILHI
jgi:hypothetical protein